MVLPPVTRPRRSMTVGPHSPPAPVQAFSPAMGSVLPAGAPLSRPLYGFKRYADRGTSCHGPALTLIFMFPPSQLPSAAIRWANETVGPTSEAGVVITGLMRE